MAALHCDWGIQMRHTIGIGTWARRGITWGCRTLLALAVGVATPAAGQVAPSILIVPWDQDTRAFQTRNQLFYIPEGNVSGSDDGIDVLLYDSYGRVKFEPQNADPVFSLGYRLTTADLNTSSPDLPGGFTDVAAAAAVNLGEVFDGWEMGVIGGAGIATDNHFDDSDALYAVGTVHFSHRLDERSALHLGLSFDGNRPIFPDIPLPYVTYVLRPADGVVLQLGVPVTSVTWRPTEMILIEARYLVPVTLLGRASLLLTDEWSLFVEYDQDTTAFHREADDENRRLFYRQRRVGGGVRYRHERLEVAAGAGFAFDQEFERGWDLRDTDTVVELSDEPYFFLTLEGRF